MRACRLARWRDGVAGELKGPEGWARWPSHRRPLHKSANGHLPRKSSAKTLPLAGRVARRSRAGWGLWSVKSTFRERLSWVRRSPHPAPSARPSPSRGGWARPALLPFSAPGSVMQRSPKVEGLRAQLRADSSRPTPAPPSRRAPENFRPARGSRRRSCPHGRARRTRARGPRRRHRSAARDRSAP